MPQALIPIFVAAAGAGINAASEAARKQPNVQQEASWLMPKGMNLDDFAKMQGTDQMKQRAQGFADKLMLGEDTSLSTAQAYGGAEGLKGQQFLQGQLQNQILGKGPTVAEQQLRAGQSRNLAANMAMAASARGPQGIAGAQYNAQQMGAGQNLATNQQAGIQRAGEQIAAMGQLQGLSGQMRDQGMGMSDLALKSLLGRYQTGLGFENLGLGISQADTQARQNYLRSMQDYQLGLKGNRTQEMKIGNENTQFYTKYIGGAAQGGAQGETAGGGKG